MNQNSKPYGLILSKKPELSTPRAGNIFGEDNDSEKEDGIDWVKRALKAEGEKHRIKKQTKLNMQKALNQDPTIFQYDEVYDEIEKKKEEVKVVEKKETKKSKYIGNLLKAAERRKREQEHRIERMVQKEREAEGEQFSDKESFVTSAYRAKLEEFKKLEEEEARMDVLEAIGDVTKQPDISGFYRQLYFQTVNKKENFAEKNTNKKLEKCQSRNILEKDIDLSDSSDSSCEKKSKAEVLDRANIKKKTSKQCNVKSQKTRQYRKRNVATSECESELEEDRSDQDSNNGENTFHNSSDEKINKSQSGLVFKKARLSLENDESDAADDDNNKLENSLKDSNELEVERQTDTKSQTNTPENFEEENKEKAEKKPRVSIWKKRTIGPIFEAALQGYYARKAIRLS